MQTKNSRKVISA